MAPQLVTLAPGLSVTGRLDRPDIEQLARTGVRTIINNRPDGEDQGQLSAVEAQRIAEAHGLAYHHIPITAATLSRADVDAFAAALRDAPAPAIRARRSCGRWFACARVLTLLPSSPKPRGTASTSPAFRRSPRACASPTSRGALLLDFRAYSLR